MKINLFARQWFYGPIALSAVFFIVMLSCTKRLSPLLSFRLCDSRREGVNEPWERRGEEEEKRGEERQQRESRWWISAPTGPIDANELGSSPTAFCPHKQDITSVGAELHWEKPESRGQSEVHGCSSWARWRRWSDKALDWWGPSWCWSEFLHSVALH